MIKTWLDMIEVHILDWDRARRQVIDDTHRLLTEVTRLRKVIEACDNAPDLERVKSIIRIDRTANKY